MISKKYFKIIFPLLMSLSMVLVMSFMMIYINFGFGSDFFEMWFKSILRNFPVGFATSLFVSPFVARLSHKICSK